MKHKAKRLFLLSAFMCCWLIFYCQPKAESGQSKPFVIGETDVIKSVILSEERIVNIYLPQEYNPRDTTKYPVVYLLDGGADEDFIHVTGLYQFNSFPWIGRVAPSIIVGIGNKDRMRDMTYPTTDSVALKKFPTSGHSDKFAGFIEQELQPYIQMKFKTTSSKTLIGESLGGLLATEILLKKPALFNTYIIVSPSLWWDHGSLLTESSAILQSSFQQKTSVYIGVGKEGLTPGNPPRVMEVDANLLADEIKSTKSKSVVVYFDYLPEENHATIMHQAVFNVLRLMNPLVPAQK